MFFTHFQVFQLAAYTSLSNPKIKEESITLILNLDPLDFEN
jgi:hypothetical protein